jgi:hypothetical protein
MRKLKGIVRGLYRFMKSTAYAADRKLDPKYHGMPIGDSISLSNNGAYPAFCREASEHDSVFANFRREPVYNQILEHVSEEYGRLYLAEIEPDAEIMAMMAAFRENDLWGNPRVFSYPEIGVMSPTTLRYVKVMKDLKDLFGSLDGFRVCEIGVGYGGQCRIVDSYFRLSQYHLADLEPVLRLAQAFLDKYVLNSSVAFRTMNELGLDQYDLAISNYAFSELVRPVQDAYLRKVLLPARRGYITYNNINPDCYASYRVDELLALIPGARVFEEKPLTYQENCVIAWGGDW